jgi:hypothetical protein
MPNRSIASIWGRMLPFMFAIVLTLADAAWGATGPAATRGVRAAVPTRFPIRSARIRPNLGSGQTYTIVNLGAPSTTSYSSSSPVAFNNTGQIVGTAYLTSKQTVDCVMYNHGSFVDLTASAAQAACGVGSLSKANKGKAHLVGTLRTPFEQAAVAFSGAFVTTTSGFTLTEFAANDLSNLFGVNSSGEAVGVAWYAPLGGFYSDQPYFVLPAATSTLQPMQPQCVTVGQALCAAPNFAPTASCPFGGCSINDSGLILGWDPHAATPSLMTYTYGQSTSAKDIPIVGPQLYGDAFINNAGQIAYSAYNSALTNVVAYVYSSATGATTAIPSIPGNSCADYVPISFSNLGQVLGLTENCGAFTDYIYWTWDPVNGTQNLATEFSITGYSTVTPLGVNDGGQILASLVTNADVTGWGTLNPPAGARRRRPAARRR